MSKTTPSTLERKLPQKSHCCLIYESVLCIIPIDEEQAKKLLSVSNPAYTQVTTKTGEVLYLFSYRNQISNGKIRICTWDKVGSDGALVIVGASVDEPRLLFLRVILGVGSQMKRAT